MKPHDHCESHFFVVREESSVDSRPSLLPKKRQGEFDAQIRQLKRRFRLSMNGVVSSNMKDRGVDYALNFGVALPTLRRMAREITASRALAEALWQEPVRECRIMATLLLPAEECDEELLSRWMRLPVQNELIEQLAMNVTSHCPSVHEWAMRWIRSERRDWQLLGFLTLGRVKEQGIEGEESIRELLRQGFSLVNHSSVYLNAVTSACDRIADRDFSLFEQVLQSELALSSLSDPIKEYFGSLYCQE